VRKMTEIKAFVKWVNTSGFKHPLLVFPGKGYLCMCYQCCRTIKLQSAISEYLGHALPKGGTMVTIPKDIIIQSGSRTKLAKSLVEEN